MCALRDRTARPPEYLGCVTAFRTRGSIPCAAMRLSLHEKRRDHFRHAFCLFNCLTNTPLKLRFFSVAPKEARNGYRCNMSEIWQSSVRYKAFLHLRGFSIWSAYRPQSTIRRKGKGRGDFTYPWRRTFQGGQKALPIFLPTAPLFHALSLKGTQRYIFLGKVLTDSGSFQGAFF